MPRWRISPFTVIVVATLIRVILAVSVPLFPDETYYWEWSRHLAAGYFDHPPTIALLIRAGTILFGDTRFGVRIGAIIMGAIVSWALAVLARQLGDRGNKDNPSHDRPAVRAALLVTCIPVALVGFVLATPDAPLLATVAVMLVALDRAFAAPPRSWTSLGWWCAAGVMLGVGLCAKYTAILIPFGVFCAILIRPGLRKRLWEPGPYAATLIALGIFSPVILWNATHHWVSFAFQLHHGLGHLHTGSALTRELELIGGQLGLISPILAVMGGIIVVQSLRTSSNDRRFAIAAIATAIAAFFFFSALRKPVEANWPAPFVLAVLPLLATWDMSPNSRRWWRWGIGLSTTCTVVLTLHATLGILPLPANHDPVAKAYGWEDAATRVAQIRETIAQDRSCAHVWVAANRYQDAAELAFHLRGHPTIFALNISGRPNQYDLWPTLWTTAQPSDCFLMVVDDDAQGRWVAHHITATADSVHDAGVVLLTRKNYPVGRRHLWMTRPPAKGALLMQTKPTAATVY